MKFENHQHYNCEITLSDGSTFKVSANWIHNENLDYWQDWHCEAGTTRLDIDKDFNVHSGKCKNDFLGNLFADWHIMPNGTTCSRLRCTGCTDDLITKKYKPGSNKVTKHE